MAGPDVGDRAPPFTLPDATGTPRELDEFLGQPVILYFYPADFTMFCTREACQFQEAFPDLERQGVHVVGISDDPPGKHASFKERYGLSFTLLSDEDGEVIEAYGAAGFLKTKRITFVLDPEGTIVARIGSLLPGRHVDQALAQLEEAA